MGVAWFIVAERAVEGLETYVNGKFLAKCPYLGGLADEAGVRSLLDFFSMSPEDAADFFGDADLDDEEQAESLPEGFEPESWFEAGDGLNTVRGLISRLEAGPVDLPDDPVPDEIAELRAIAGATSPRRPSQSEMIEDLREFEVVLNRLASEGIRWHLAIDI